MSVRPALNLFGEWRQDHFKLHTVLVFIKLTDERAGKVINIAHSHKIALFNTKQDKEEDDETIYYDTTDFVT